MQVIETKVYEFNELSETAKDRARDWWCENGNFFNADHVIYDAKSAGDCLGIDIEKIYYSGFSSQGDGACFDGRYTYKPKWGEALKAYAPKDETLKRIGKALQDAQKKHFYKLEAKTTHRGHYYHSGCMTIDVENRDDRGRDIGYQETEISDALRGFADWVYRQLEAAYEWETADDQVDETITANGYTFTEDGKRFG